MKITIIGLGLIGGSIAKDLRKSGFATELLGMDTNVAHAEEALKLGLIDRILPEEKALKQADMVIIAIPVDKIVEILPGILDEVSDNTTVTDMGSAKSVITRSVMLHPRRKNYVPVQICFQ